MVQQKRENTEEIIEDEDPAQNMVDLQLICLSLKSVDCKQCITYLAIIVLTIS